jgi:hypothetical protein
MKFSFYYQMQKPALLVMDISDAAAKKSGAASISFDGMKRR